MVGSGFAFAALLADGSVVTWGNGAKGGEAGGIRRDLGFRGLGFRV